MLRRAIAAICLAVLLGALPGLAGSDRYGSASFYGVGDGLGYQRTGSGEIMDPYAMTCATHYYPLGTRLRVTNLANGKSVVVRVNDRGGSHLLDLSYGAFRRIASPSTGIIRVKVQVVRP